MKILLGKLRRGKSSDYNWEVVSNRRKVHQAGSVHNVTGPAADVRTSCLLLFSSSSSSSSSSYSSYSSYSSSSSSSFSSFSNCCINAHRWSMSGLHKRAILRAIKLCQRGHLYPEPSGPVQAKPGSNSTTPAGCFQRSRWPSQPVELWRASFARRLPGRLPQDLTELALLELEVTTPLSASPPRWQLVGNCEKHKQRKTCFW